MKRRISRFICAMACTLPITVSAQNIDKITSPNNLYEEGRNMFLQQNYAVANSLLQNFVSEMPQSNMREEAEYMLACTQYELRNPKCLQLFENYLEVYPDSPYANRIYAMMGACYFYHRDFNRALAMFNSSELYMLPNQERDLMTYLQAVCFLEIGNLKEAAIWFEMLKGTSPKYAIDCTYYLSYIRYAQQRYDEALNGFLSLQDNDKYQELVPYYIAEIYLLKHNYDKAEIVAQNYLSHYSNNEYTVEMYRILGEADYYMRKYDAAIKALEYYADHIAMPRRNALYMLGMSYYQTGVNSKAAEALGRSATATDELAQNAYLHMGLAYINLSERNKARMAFEQAAAMDFDPNVKEQAAYNYALALHESSYSGFGESVVAFEKFLNDYPQSPYKDMVSNYLVETYLTTRSYEAALKSIERIKHPDRRIVEAKQKILFQLGTQAFANSNFNQAVDYFNQSIASGQYNQPIKADAMYWKGESLYRLGNLNGAEQSFKQFLQNSKQANREMNAQAYYNLGYVAFDQKRYAEARTHFLRYAEMVGQTSNNPVLADANNRIADTYLQSRQFDDAKHYYALSETIHPNAGDYAFYQMAFVSGLQKDYSGKITLLNRLMGKYPNSQYAVNALYEKGRSYVMMDNNAQAISSFNELLSKYPNSPISRKAAAEIGLLHYQAGSYDKAINAYKHVVKTYPGSEEARLAMLDLKSIYVDMNKIDEFAALANAMPGNIRFDATEQDSLTYMAAEKIYLRGRTEEAKGSFGKYLQSYPDGAFTLNAHYYLGTIANDQKDYDNVLSHTEAILRYPDSPYAQEALLMRAEVLFNQHRFADALQNYKLLRDKTMQPDRRILATTGMLRSAFVLSDDVETINAATMLLNENKLSPEVSNEAHYYRAKAYLNLNANNDATDDLRFLAKDTRNVYGAEAKYLLAEQAYNNKQYNDAEKQLIAYIDQSTPHMYWLARSFVLLSDVYVALGKPVDARQYLLSLQQNYEGNDDITSMINSRLEKLNQ